MDGDNIAVNRFVCNIQAEINEFTRETPKPIVFCQSNLVFKYESQKELDVCFKCCKTQNKNATDARIIFETGRALERGEKVIIVSNDKIFKELESDHIVIFKCDIVKPSKLRKNAIIKIINEFRSTRESHEDIYVSDILEYFPSYKMERITNYIQSIPELQINVNGGIYYTP